MRISCSEGVFEHRTRASLIFAGSAAQGLLRAVMLGDQGMKHLLFMIFATTTNVIPNRAGNNLPPSALSVIIKE
jgi:hypothetical protein